MLTHASTESDDRPVATDGPEIPFGSVVEVMPVADLPKLEAAFRERVREKLTHMNSAVVEAVAKFLCGVDSNIHGEKPWSEQPEYGKDGYRQLVAGPLAETIFAALDSDTPSEEQRCGGIGKVACGCSSHRADCIVNCPG